MQAAGLEAGASDSSQLGTQRQRQQDSQAPAQLLDLCWLTVGLLAAPQLQPALARFPASWQEQLQGRVYQVARAAFIALPMLPSEATPPRTLQLAWQGTSAMACLMLRWLSRQGPAAATAGRSNSSRSGSANSSRPVQLAYLPDQLGSAAVDAAQHLPAACDALALMADSQRAGTAEAAEATARCTLAVILLSRASSAADALHGGLFGANPSAAQHVATCARAIAAALRYLPAMEELGRCCEAGLSAGEPGLPVQEVAQSLIELWYSWSAAAFSWAAHQQPASEHSQQLTGKSQAAEAELGSGAAAAFAEAQPQLERLHTIGCRVLHFLATPSGQRLLTAPGKPWAHSWLQVVSALNCSLCAAAMSGQQQLAGTAGSNLTAHNANHPAVR